MSLHEFFSNTYVYIGYDSIEWNEDFSHDLMGLEMIQDSLIKALKEVNKRIINNGDE